MSQLLAFSLNCIFYKLHHSRVLLSFMSRQQGHNCTNNSTTKSAAYGNELAARHTEHLERKAAHPHSKKVEIRMRSITTSLPSALPISIWVAVSYQHHYVLLLIRRLSICDGTVVLGTFDHMFAYSHSWRIFQNEWVYDYRQDCEFQSKYLLPTAF